MKTMKQYLSVLMWIMALAAVLQPMRVAAYDFEQDGIFYSIKDSCRVAVVAGDGFEGTYRGAVVIPDSVAHDGVCYRVTSIEDAFFKCTQLSSVTIPPTITDLYWDAFLDAMLDRIIVRDLEAWYGINFVEDGCFARMDFEHEVDVYGCGMEADQDVENLVIPSSVTSIHDFTFYKISSIKRVVIPDQVTSVGEGAFFGCRQLESLTIGPNVSAIGSYAFDLDDFLAYWNFYDDGPVINEVTCMAVVPPVLPCKECFNQATYKRGTLYVPAQALKAYCLDENWGRFENILPIPGPEPGDVDGNGVVNISDVTTLVNRLLNGQ